MATAKPYRWAFCPACAGCIGAEFPLHHTTPWGNDTSAANHRTGTGHKVFMLDFEQMQEESVAPTVKTDYRSRVLGYVSLEKAQAEAENWRLAGYNARIVAHAGIRNVIVSERAAA